MFTVVVTCITITPIVMEAKPKLKNNNTNKLDNIILLWRRRRGKRGWREERGVSRAGMLAAAQKFEF